MVLPGIIFILLTSCGSMIDDLIPTEVLLTMNTPDLNGTWQKTNYEIGRIEYTETSPDYLVSYYINMDGEIYDGIRGDVNLTRVGSAHWFGHFYTFESWDTDSQTWETAPLEDDFMPIEIYYALGEITLYVDWNKDGLMEARTNDAPHK